MVIPWGIEQTVRYMLSVLPRESTWQLLQRICKAKKIGTTILKQGGTHEVYALPGNNKKKLCSLPC